ncbi:SixA phosphatase family protein [Chryseolinea lacunae]|uniref:Histidine phosphatase family protein n=1 Tax=Chryseolinea lacunae TaxID=2801331 RepID=A0ABS1KPL0_9BACT|nr:histidine phosphatase family protein [Chryseolinea lacunae]
MKTLYIIRHAKSSWEDPLQGDHDRPLNERGKRDAPRMGKRLKEKNIHPDAMVSSTAKRALSTAKRIAKVLEFPKDSIKKEKTLYHADEVTLLSTVQELNDKLNTVMLFGHNPGLTDFVNTLMDREQDIDNVPTCGVVAFEFDFDKWSDVNWGKGTMLFFDYPKSKED